MANCQPAIVIPAYNPDHRLTQLVQTLREQTTNDQQIVVVNDGSDSRSLFTELQALPNVEVLHHEHNQGKGAALKSGFSWIQKHVGPQCGAITADADGQHLPKDILALAQAFITEPEALWLGCRDFSAKDIPFRSWFGNTFARYTFRLGLRINIPDTQTGLRGVPASLLPELIDTPSNRYEFELDMLIIAKRNQLDFRNKSITTVYEKGNKSSHFKPLQDSIKIYSKFLKFSGVGIASAGLDYGLFALIYGFTGEILAAIAVARLCSGVFNFSMNRQWVFGRGGSLARDATHYSLLAATLVGINYLLTKGLLLLGVSPFIGKPGAEVIVFLLSYRLQKKLVFHDKNPA
ncbi:Undecaprenyl-phosphate mannosyltransferase [Pseudidiomarina piscicola]|uniref:Undecaprenyl-phosphate mannosyltransferase n=1 Tax=Pseudidiomarina piscicola TaxID=2614830 RepID=A0A6S6WR87_9GAMM|nr:bifunctional glycosyltransferase family 2/GtrA family protein [Pseudidiomarina piscicola]CAB0151723.1 Undecaprenyl-phosphate mannosyltransferase [Pseudidiomarina piscicola]VZT41180.1 Undecaprenyl-phosphate mannosyltransferase [Pseudomonas aeruginosa]